MKLTKRKGFNFFRSYYDVYNELNDKDKLAFMDALLDRQFLGIKPEGLKGMVNFAYISQTNSIDSQVKGYEDKTGIKLDSRELEGGSVAPSVGGSVGGSAPPSVQVQVQEKEKEKEKKNIPSFEDFFIHAKSKIANVDKKDVKLKYDSWIENDWKDGNDKKITNWKSKLTNTVGFLKKIEEKKPFVYKRISL
jgi:hypothetical protein